MKGITVLQPWASYLAEGVKKYETRSWSTNYRGPIAIHAGKSDVHIAGLLENTGHTMPLGAIIAIGHLHHVHPMDEHFIGMQSAEEIAMGHWEPGRYAWEITQVEKLPVPIPYRGQQGLWPYRQTLQQADQAKLQAACRDRCAFYGDAPCWQLCASGDVAGPWRPCAKCVAGEPVEE